MNKSTIVQIISLDREIMALETELRTLDSLKGKVLSPFLAAWRVREGCKAECLALVRADLEAQLEQNRRLLEDI